MNLQVASTAPGKSPIPAGAGRQPFRADDVKLLHLRGPAAVASVLHLRNEIDLSVHAAAGPQFDALEKKETSAVSCSVSSWMES
jgi:hypothetical protein